MSPSVTEALSLQSFDKQPSYTEVNPKEQTKLSCIILNKKGDCIWQRNRKVSCILDFTSLIYFFTSVSATLNKVGQKFCNHQIQNFIFLTHRIDSNMYFVLSKIATLSYFLINKLKSASRSGILDKLRGA